jgi:hypothetical protein
VANWDVFIRYSSGSTSWTDLTDHIIYNSLNKDEMLFNSDYTAAKDMFTCKLRKNSTEIDNLLAAEKRIEFKVSEGSTGIFRGILDQSFSQSIGNIVGPVRLEAVDNSYLLDKKIAKSFSYPTTVGGSSWCIFATSTTKSIVHSILSTAGYATTQISTTRTIPKKLQHVAETEDDRTYKSFFNQLLKEHGYVYRFNENGKFTVVNLRTTSTAPAKVFGSSNVAINPSVTRQKTIMEDEAVRIEWNKLKEFSPSMLYEKVDEIDEYGHWQGNIQVASGKFWPEDGSTEEVYQKYDIEHLHPNRGGRRAGHA